MGYRNHCMRVFHFTRALAPEVPDRDRKIAIAAYFHDLGIWTADTLDYLAPSMALARAHLREYGPASWIAEIDAMISEHHKITPFRDPDFPLVEPFRLADRADVSCGLWRSGLDADFVRAVQDAYPDAGFHRRLLQLGARRLREAPWDPLPMLKW